MFRLTLSFYWVVLSAIANFRATGVGVAALVLGFLNPVCWKYECCHGNRAWIPNNASRLKELLETELYGQHIATKIVFNQVGAYLREKNPTKPFVIHISGKTGTGKNHISNLIARSRYYEGVESKYVLKIIATHSYSYMTTQEAQQKIAAKVKNHVSSCQHSMVIFDEVDKLPSGTLDILSHLLDNNHEIDGIDYRKTLFVFLSNTAGNLIQDYLHRKLEAGFERESISVLEMESAIQRLLYSNGELGLSSILSRFQIDAYVPLFPLERRHVKMCANNLLTKRKDKCKCGDAEECTSVRAEDVVKEIGFSGRFSLSGCKKIETKVNLVCGPDVPKTEL